MSGRRASGGSRSEGGEWYADGLRFACTQCGNCCTGPPGAVWFTPAEGRRMAAALGLDEATFLERYARREDGRWTLVERLTGHGYDCVMLDRERVPGKAVCGLYAARPTQCRTWPFWPENLRTPRSWASVKRATPCPGMNEGRLVPVEEIRIQRDAGDGDWLARPGPDAATEPRPASVPPPAPPASGVPGPPPA